MTQSVQHSHIGRIEPFIPENGVPWNIYIESIEFFYSANGITEDEKKKNVFLSTCGSQTFGILRDLIVPETLQAITYQLLLEKAKNYFAPPPSEIVERFKFQKRLRKPSEAVSDFIKDLRKLSEFCNFGATLENRLRDQFVFGIQDDRIQQKLLDTKNLTLKLAIDIALSFEISTAGVKSLQSKEQFAVNKVGNTPNSASTFRKPKQTDWKANNTFRKNNSSGKTCYRCLKHHDPMECPYKSYECRVCRKVGHLQVACRLKKSSTVPQKEGKDNKIRTVTEHLLNYMNESNNDLSFSKCLIINGKEIHFEVDSGAAYSIISISKLDTLFRGKVNLIKSDIKLNTYTGEHLTVLGEVMVDVIIDDMCISNLKLLVIKEEGPSLIGKTWLKASKLFWPSINMINGMSKDELINKFPNVFSDGIGTIKGPPVSVKLKKDAKPVFLKARTVPFALRQSVDVELDRLINSGILKPVDYSDWASPVVIVPKSNGSVRICGDYRATVNANTENDNYPLPRTEELFAKLAGAKYFSIFDLKDAYLQQPVDIETSKLFTMNTHRGLFNVTRLCFGVKFAPGLFQRKIENILKKFEFAGVFLDDVIISAKSETEHIERVMCILKCFSEHGIRLNKEKFKFMVPEVCYLGHKISKEGVKPIPEKVAAIVNAPSPKNVSQLRSLLGLVSYYRSFLPNVAEILEPLYRLLDNDVQWSWTDVHGTAFQKVKEMLSQAPILELYDVKKDVVLCCDASEYGLGCVLNHIVDGIEKPIAYASRTLNKAQRNYAQIDKEALAIIFGVTKFHQYLAGKKFKIVTDHKPLLRLFSPCKKIPDALSPRMLRWSLLLSGYNYSIDYREGKKNTNADALSRLPLPETGNVNDIENPPEVMFVSNDEDWPVTSETVAKWTLENPITKQVLHWVLHGWPRKNKSPEFEPYFRRRESISCLENCLLWGHRVVIPDQGRDSMLKLLHSVHQGMSSMKAKARGVIWWPNMDREIEQLVNACIRCQMFARDNPKLKPLEWKSGNPWERIHVDHAGPFKGKYFLIVVDSYSKWLEVRIVPNTECKTTINVLRQIFATFGLPVEVVSDNGTSYTGYQFREFLRINGIKHTLIPPFHPSSNGQAERYVQTVKSSLKKLENTDMTLSISRFLLANHTTPHSVTGKTPSELMFGRLLRTALHLVIPAKPNSSEPLHKYKLDETVFVKNFGKGEKWLSGKIIKLLGSRWVLVKRNDAIICKRHVNQLRHNKEISQEMRQNENENFLSRESFGNEYKNYEIVSENISKDSNANGEQRNDLFWGLNQSQSPGDKVTETVIENVISKDVAANDVPLPTSYECADTDTETHKNFDKSPQQLVRRSNRQRKKVSRLNYEGRGVISS